MHDFMVKMEDDGDMNVALPLTDWEGLAVSDDDPSDFSMNGFMMNHFFSGNENAGLDDGHHHSLSPSISPEVECKGSIAERRAAKFGFDASRINVAKFKRSSPPNSPPIRSPYLTIPPGISPAALLDSPVMLPNSQAQPSPTTGTLQFQQSDNDGLLVPSKGSSIPTSVSFKTPGCSTSQMLSSVENKIPAALTSPTAPMIEDSQKNCATEASTDAKFSGKMTHKASHMNLQKNHMKLKGETPEEQKGAHNLTDISRSTEDGYSWRKYGQKHVKGSEFPRSYYKCNNSSCLVKKKVERSHDGEITEIIYKGAHNHPKPHPRISLFPAPSAEMMETGEGREPCVRAENGTNPNAQLRNKDPRIGTNLRPDGLDTTSSNSVSTDKLDPLAATQGKSPELTSRRIGCQDGEDEDGATQGSTSQSDEADESEPKRRKKEMLSAEAYLPSRSNRETRVIVQIESEIDVLDDGYRWRKYGQKVVKGNPNPRSYYKCTSAGCPVRKHVERASDNIKSVLTTYEGKHNHEVPTTKTSGIHTTFNPSHNEVVGSRNQAREIKVEDLPLHYEMKPDFLLADFGNDMQIGPSSIYPMKFPPAPSLPNSMPFSSFMMNTNGAPAMLDFPMSIPMNVPMNNTFHHPYNPNDHGMQTGMEMQYSVGDQHMKEGDLMFLRPKEEKREDTCIMGNFPS